MKLLSKKIYNIKIKYFYLELNKNLKENVLEIDNHIYVM